MEILESIETQLNGSEIEVSWLMLVQVQLSELFDLHYDFIRFVSEQLSYNMFEYLQEKGTNKQSSISFVLFTKLLCWIVTSLTLL